VAEPPQPVIIPDQTKPPPQQQQAKIEPQPVPQLRPKVPPDQTKPKVKPQPQQQATDFNSLLKNVEKMNTQTADNTDQQQQTPQPPQPQTDQLGAQLSSSELDAVRSQIAGCWYLDPGKKGADSMGLTIGNSPANVSRKASTTLLTALLTRGQTDARLRAVPVRAPARDRPWASRARRPAATGTRRACRARSQRSA